MVWSQWIFLTVSLISLPLYLLTIVVCSKEWTRNHQQRTFYLLIISQGIVDFIVIINYFIFWTLRTQHFFIDFYWNLQNSYLPTWIFIQTYISVIIRCFGVLLITFHRYLSMCKNHSQIEQFVNVTHRWTLPIFQWIIPLIYSIPFLTIHDVIFDSKDNLEIIAKKEEITLAASLTAIFVFVTFILCGFFYGSMLKFLLNNRYNSNIAIRREVRLYVQMLGVFIVFGFFLLYQVVAVIFSIEGNDGPIFTLRLIFPIISCFLSYINLWMMFILNTDLRRGILSLIYYGRKQNLKAKTITIKSTQATSRKPY